MLTSYHIYILHFLALWWRLHVECFRLMFRFLAFNGFRLYLLTFAYGNKWRKSGSEQDMPYLTLPASLHRTVYPRMSERPGSSGWLQDSVTKSRETMGAVRCSGLDGPPALLAGSTTTSTKCQHLAVRSRRLSTTTLSQLKTPNCATMLPAEHVWAPLGLFDCQFYFVEFFIGSSPRSNIWVQTVFEETTQNGIICELLNSLSVS